jgi:hypothetical protein
MPRGNSPFGAEPETSTDGVCVVEKFNCNSVGVAHLQGERRFTALPRSECLHMWRPGTFRQPAVGSCSYIGQL